MSWSASASGTPSEVIASLEQQFNAYGPSASKEEFALALPHLVWLVGQVSGPHTVELTANGSKSTAESSIYVKLATVYVPPTS